MPVPAPLEKKQQLKKHHPLQLQVFPVHIQQMTTACKRKSLPFTFQCKVLRSLTGFWGSLMLATGSHYHVYVEKKKKSGMASISIQLRS